MIKAYKRGSAEESLQKDLGSLRQGLAKDEALMVTAKAVMPDFIMDRIIDLAHHRLIKTVAILHEQVTWGYLDRCDNTIFDLVNKHCPLPPTPSLFSTAPLQRASTSSSESQVLTSSNVAPTPNHSSKRRACQICGMLGHYSMSFLAPMYLFIAH